MASSSSNIPPDASRYLHASNANASNFVSVKLSGRQNYHLWKAQMLCLMESHNMCGIVDDTFSGPLILGIETHKQYDSLLKGWIFGSIGEEVLGDVYNLGSAKDVWKKLNATYDTTSPNLIDSIATKPEAKTEINDINAAPTQAVKETNDNDDILLIQVIGKEKDLIEIGTEAETEIKDTIEEFDTELHKVTMKGDWEEAEKLLKKNKDAATKAISKDGTVLHIAVGVGHNDFVKKFISFIKDDQALVKKRDVDGSTALHIAAIVGNTDAAELMVKRDKRLLQIKDNEGKEPLHKAYENMHLDTIGYLLKAQDDDGVGHSKKLVKKIISFIKDDQALDQKSTSLHTDAVELMVKKKKKMLLIEDNKNKEPFQMLNAAADDGKNKQHPVPSGDNCYPQHPGDEIGVDLLVNAISAKQYDLVNRFPEFVAKNDHVLMALAKTFPSGLDDWETLMYPSLESHWTNMINSVMVLLFILVSPIMLIVDKDISNSDRLKGALVGLLGYICVVIYFIISIVCLSLSFLYFIWWKIAEILAFAPIYHIEKKKKEWDNAKEVLELVCNEIDKLEFSGTDHHPYYTEPILEAACQNAYEVVNEILSRSRETIRCKNKCGYDIIQLAVIHRSEKIYNLIYDIGERRNLYRTILDSSKNNILHLAGRLAPSCKLNRRTGAALQLQRELQWREEVKKLVFPSYISQENMFKETPDMVFTREHENLVKDGERWMKATAESCSITAALITTIVFAAAITVPGGSNTDGTPVYETKDAFTVFSISDAISLFASSTALLVFLSILTSRFAEQDFLVSLPRRLIIGLSSLLVSTIAMMVAFSASLFLVFGQQRKWVLAPICGLAFIPIAFFVTLQFPLIVDLFRSTFVSTFGKRSKGRFNPDDIRLFFLK